MTTNSDTKKDHAREQASAQMDAITAMVKRLNHAGECSGDPQDGCGLTDKEIIEGMGEWYKEGAIATDEQREKYHDEDAVREAITEDALEVSVRGGWHTPGDGDHEDTDFLILLCTGGPAVRVRGELRDGRPYRAWLEYQDWGTPWTEYHDMNFEADDLLAYAQEYYFGE
jgi:hypothetical protein